MNPKRPVFFAVLCCAVLLASGGARAAEADTDEHGHAETSAPAAGQQCPGEDGFIAAFNSAAASLNISDHDGHRCMIEDDHDEHGDEHDDDDDHKEGNSTSTDHEEGPSCDSVAQLVRRVILRLNLTTEECLEHGHNDTPTTPTARSTSAEAYGLGLLMVLIVCVGSLAGIVIIPFIHTKSPITKLVYSYVYAFMVALAISALVSDALLHLIPLVFRLHGHAEEEGSDHAHEEEEEDREYLWKACVVLAGIYLFYLLELFLHGLTDYLKARGAAKDHEDQNETALTDVKDGSNHDDETKDTKEFEEKPSPKICDLSCRRIRPVAWLVIIGDSLHNFADGLAIGAAVSVSVPLGVATSIAVLLHEIPHELGDYAVLIKSGIHWFTALLFNFISALTAIIGLFIGVAVSQNTATANEWILAITAGLFLYIGLVDLLPDLIHGDNDGPKLTINNWRWWVRFLVINVGFLVSFAVLLLLAVYEEQIRF